MERIKELIKKLFSKEVIFYVLFGALTTLVNIGSFYIMNSIFRLEENFSNIIAICIAVLTAYFTNKDLVFHSEANEFGEKIVEFCRFILGRLFTMAIEYIGCAILFKYATFIPNIVSKCVITVLVIILNFFISKFFAFKKKGINDQF